MSVTQIRLDTQAQDATLTNAKIANDQITNAKINSAAAIAYSKLNLTGSIVNADVNASAAIAYSKLNLTGSIVNADVNATANIAYSKLADLGGSANAVLIQSGNKVAPSAIISTDLIQRTGSVAFTADQSHGGFKITNLADPVSAQDAATKFYVDSVSAGLDPKASVRVATTVAGTLATSFENGDTIDGVTLATGNRILIKNQATASQNGIYTVNSSGAPTRATDFDGSPANEVSGGAFTFVEQGTVNVGTGWVVVWDGNVVVGTDAINFTQFSDTGTVTYLAGAGLTQTGTTTVTFDVVAGDASILVNANSLQVQEDAAGAITTSGSGIKVNLESSNPSLQISSNQLGVKFDPAGTITSGASGIKVGVDNSTIEINTNALRLKDGGITNAKINASAAIDFSKLASLATGHILAGNAGVVTDVTLSGDATISATGVLTLTATALGSTHFVDKATPSGTIDGSNVTFTLASTPIVGSEHLYLNGILQNPGAGNDYTISGTTITYLSAPITGSVLLVSYRK